VAGAVIDREEWARFVQELLDEEAAPLTEGGRPRVHGAKTRFAAKAGLKTSRTVDTWLRREVDVRQASVRDVATGYGRNPVDVLVRVGFLTADQVPARTVDDVVDEEIAIVLESDLDDVTKAAFIQELEKWRDEDRELQRRLAQRDKERRIANLRERIQQANRS
jgi:hypothetical protein